MIQKEAIRTMILMMVVSIVSIRIMNAKIRIGIRTIEKFAITYRLDMTFFLLLVMVVEGLRIRVQVTLQLIKTKSIDRVKLHRLQG